LTVKARLSHVFKPLKRSLLFNAKFVRKLNRLLGYWAAAKSELPAVIASTPMRRINRNVHVEVPCCVQ